MIHPSYVELMKVVNNDVAIGEEPVVNSRYSIVIASAKRARQLIDGALYRVDSLRCTVAPVGSGGHLIGIHHVISKAVGI